MIGLSDVEAAAGRLEGVAHVTPVLTSRTLDAEVRAEVHLKAENLQRVGAFKFRGAYNAIRQHVESGDGRGVFTYSSGNHAQAVALASSLLGVPATILMPEDAPPLKRVATEGYGAEVIAYDRYTEDREALGARLAEERGLALVPPYDDERVMAGQGTVALELLRQVRRLDVVVTPVGGGGLLSGCAAVAAASGVRAVGVEPEVRRVGRDALAAGHPVTARVARTIADGQQTPSIGARPFELISTHTDGVVGVTDEAIVDAMRFAFERLKIVLEPSGASALAAVRSGAVPDVAGRRVGVVLSGGNVDLDRFAELVGPAKRWS